MDTSWGLRTPAAETVSREPATITGLRMAGSGDDGNGGNPAGDVGGEGAKAVTPVPTGSWTSLAMLLLVYVSNQWTRSLVYCEFGVGFRDDYD